MDKLNNAILKTLSYGDLFDFPMTKEETWKYLVINQASSIKYHIFEKKVSELLITKKIMRKDSYYFLPGRGEIIQKRKQRKEESIKKIKLATQIGKILSFIPSVLLIGVSGSLAMQNADKKDDIDLFVITSKDSLWITRLSILIVLQLIGRRRGRTSENIRNTICLNMMLDEKFLGFERALQDVYIAHEITQVKPLIDKKNTYRKFFASNTWIKKFLPNAYAQALKEKSVTTYNFLFSISFLESFARIFQLYFIHKHQTSEIVNDSKVGFHPRNYRDEVLKKWSTIQRKYAV